MRRLGAVAFLLVALTAGGCTGDSPSSRPGGSASGSSPTGTTSGTPSPRRTAVAVPPAPERGACYRLSPGELTRPTNASRPVPCTGRHNARTIHVGRLDTVVDGHSVAVDSATVQGQLSTTCPRRLAEFVGGSVTDRRLSRFNVVWFSPTLEQSDQGADWFRCDLVAFGTADALLPLPRTGGLRRVLDRPAALNTYGLCGTAAFGDPEFARVSCGRRHAWRAIDAFDLPGGRRYPGERRLRRAGDDACADRARSRADNRLKFTYGWEWPTRAQWNSGQHYGFCWVRA